MAALLHRLGVVCFWAGILFFLALLALAVMMQRATLDDRLFVAAVGLVGAVIGAVARYVLGWRQPGQSMTRWKI